MTYTEPTRRAVALALGWEFAPGKPCDLWMDANGQTAHVGPPPITPADLTALNNAALSFMTSEGLNGDSCACEHCDYHPTTNDGQALALFDLLAVEQQAAAMHLLIDWRGSVPSWVVDGPPDRPALLTAAAVLASRSAE